MPIESHIQYAVESWFIEYKVTPVNAVASVFLKSGVKTGHFLQVAFDANPRVGCAIIYWEAPKDNIGINKNVQLTCNYFKAPLLDDPLYETGIPCSNPNCKCNLLQLCEPNVTTFVETYMQDLDNLPIIEY